jgi:hypothetical protein
MMRRFMGPSVASDAAARVAADRVKDAGDFGRRVLFPAVMTVLTAAPSAHERQRDDDTARRRAARAVEHFEAAVDRPFFEELDAELQALEDSPEAAEHVRVDWLLRLRSEAARVLADLCDAAPSAAMRQHRTRVRAERVFGAAFRRHFGARVDGTRMVAPPGAESSPPSASIP